MHSKMGKFFDMLNIQSKICDVRYLISNIFQGSIMLRIISSRRLGPILQYWYFSIPFLILTLHPKMAEIFCKPLSGGEGPLYSPFWTRLAFDQPKGQKGGKAAFISPSRMTLKDCKAVWHFEIWQPLITSLILYESRLEPVLLRFWENFNFPNPI